MINEIVLVALGGIVMCLIIIAYEYLILSVKNSARSEVRSLLLQEELIDLKKLKKKIMKRK